VGGGVVGGVGVGGEEDEEDDEEVRMPWECVLIVFPGNVFVYVCGWGVWVGGGVGVLV
jgi:hypothetical protein